MAYSNILISVVIPTRNRAHRLPASVASVLCQSHGNLEVLLVDDGSTDETGSTCRQLAAADARVRCYSQAWQGQSAAVNRGLEAARGSVAVMLSDDDSLYPDCLAWLAREFDAHPEAVVVAGEFDLLDWDHNVLDTIVSPSIDLQTLLLDHHCNLGVGVGFRVDAARSVGGWNPRYRHVPDMDFWMRMALQGEFRLVPRRFGGWRQHEDQMSASARDGSLDCAREHLDCVEEFLARPDLPEEFRHSASRARSAALVYAAIVLDPDHAGAERRFLVTDRFSLAGSHLRSEEGESDAVRRLVETAEERLELIRSLDARLQSCQDDNTRLREQIERRPQRSWLSSLLSRFGGQP